MPTPLSAEELQAALARLPAWSGDTTRLERTVTGPGDREQQLERIAAAADRMNHHPVVERQPSGDVRLLVWTHSADAVTELDVALAEEIDRVLGISS
jgi:4a-hydroxytetrahydrobiopterin dehydratase